MSRGSIAATLVLALLSACGGAGDVGSVQGEPPDAAAVDVAELRERAGPALAGMIIEYARAEGLPVEQALRDSWWQNRFGDLVATLREDPDSGFLASEIVHDEPGPSFGRIAYAGDVPEVDLAAAGLGDVDIRLVGGVGVSERQLDAAQDAIARTSNDRTIVVRVDRDAMAGRLTVVTASPEDQQVLRDAVPSTPVPIDHVIDPSLLPEPRE